MKEYVPGGWGERRKLFLSVVLAFAVGFAAAAVFFSDSLRSRIQSIVIKSDVPVSDYYKAPIELIEVRAQDGDLLCQKVLFNRYSSPLLGNLDLTKAERCKNLYVSEVMKRAVAGDVASQYMLSVDMRDGGPFFMKDEIEGRKWLMKSVEGGSIEARCHLALEYWQGRPAGGGYYAEKNKPLAFKIYEEIGKTFDPTWVQKPEQERWALISQQRVIEYLETSSPVEAYAWTCVYLHLYSSSYHQGLGGVNEASRRIRDKLSDDQVAAGQKRSRELLAEIEAKKAKK